MSKLTYTAIDFETSGIDPEFDLPVEVCAVRVVEGEPTATFNALIHYPDNMPWTEPLQKGHHSREDLRKGMSYHAVAEVLWQLCAGEMLVAYNALFDLSFLREMWIKCFHADGANEFREGLQFLDPLTIIRDIDTYPHKLVDACRRRGIHIPDAHLALDDTMALVELTNRLASEIDVSPYVNVVGYQRQYGLPKYAHWLPSHVQTKPQGKETFYHHADGTTTKQTFIGKPYQPVIMGKPLAPQQPVRLSPGGAHAPQPTAPPQALQAWGQMTGGQPFPEQPPQLTMLQKAMRRQLPPPSGN